MRCRRSRLLEYGVVQAMSSLMSRLWSAQAFYQDCYRNVDGTTRHSLTASFLETLDRRHDTSEVSCAALFRHMIDLAGHNSSDHQLCDAQQL